MFDVQLTILLAPNCRTLKESRKVCCWVFGFRRLITSEHFTHTPRCLTLTPRFFVSDFWVCFRVLGLLSICKFSQIDHIPTFHTPFFPGTIFPGIFFSGTIFPGFISNKLRSDNYATSILQNRSVNINGLFSSAHRAL